MKIKIHNSLLKQSRFFFILNNRTLIQVSEEMLYLFYDIQDKYFFLSFSSLNKYFIEWTGFGEPMEKTSDLKWLKSVDWEEMNEDENQTA